MAKINNEIELCIKNLKTLSVIVTLFEDNEGLSVFVAKMSEEITKLNVELTKTKNTVKSLLTGLK
ncbi:MAG: hypothetical protein V3U87_16000 [Methylococcaceae bacterium]